MTNCLKGTYGNLVIYNRCVKSEHNDLPESDSKEKKKFGIHKPKFKHRVKGLSPGPFFRRFISFTQEIQTGNQVTKLYTKGLELGPLIDLDCT